MQWFKHDADANADAKLQNVLLDYGLEGYGLYWYCIEMIAGKVCVENLSFELEHDARIIARNTGSTPQKVEEMMKYFVKIGLFECSEGVITCLKMAKRLDKSMTSNPKMRNLIENLRDKSHDGIMMIPDYIMQDKNRLDKNRKENTMSSGDDVSTKFDEQKVLSAWNKVAREKNYKGARGISDKIARSIKQNYALYLKKSKKDGKSPEDIQSLTEFTCGYLEYGFTGWATAFHSGNNDTKWRADLEYATRKSNFEKIFFSAE